jgi:23S rRNA maturation mini-RNase III
MELEYKTLQSQTPLFASAAKMHETLEQESKAGWTLLEKEDNYRVKLQRNTSNRDNDKNLDFDAYRSTVGVSSVLTYAATALFTLAVVSIILYLAMLSA